VRLSGRNRLGGIEDDSGRSIGRHREKWAWSRLSKFVEELLFTLVHVSPRFKTLMFFVDEGKRSRNFKCPWLHFELRDDLHNEVNAERRKFWGGGGFCSSSSEFISDSAGDKEGMTGASSISSVQRIQNMQEEKKNSDETYREFH
jgi:hypothetical protein